MARADQVRCKVNELGRPHRAAAGGDQAIRPRPNGGAAFERQAISIALAKGRPIADLIKTSKTLGLSIVPENDTTLMKRYARGIKPGENPFHDVETITTPSGILVLKHALAWLETRVIN